MVNTVQRISTTAKLGAQMPSLPFPLCVGKPASEIPQTDSARTNLDLPFDGYRPMTFCVLLWGLLLPTISLKYLSHVSFGSGRWSACTLPLWGLPILETDLLNEVRMGHVKVVLLNHLKISQGISQSPPKFYKT